MINCSTTFNVQLFKGSSYSTFFGVLLFKIFHVYLVHLALVFVFCLTLHLVFLINYSVFILQSCTTIHVQLNNSSLFTTLQQFFMSNYLAVLFIQLFTKFQLFNRSLFFSALEMFIFIFQKTVNSLLSNFFMKYKTIFL